MNQAYVQYMLGIKLHKKEIEKMNDDDAMDQRQPGCGNGIPRGKC